MDTESLKQHYKLELALEPPVSYTGPEHPSSCPEVKLEPYIPVSVGETQKQKDQNQEKATQNKKSRHHQRRDSLRELFIKYLGKVNRNQFHLVLFRAQEVRKGKRWTMKEDLIVPATFYCIYIDQIRLGIKHFCLTNSLPISVFLKKVRAYEQFYGQIGIRKRFLTPIELRGQADNSIERAIQLIYDKVFSSEYLQQRRREIITTLAQRLSHLDPRIWSELDELKGAEKFLLSMKLKRITWFSFRAAVQRRAGIRLAKELHSKTKAIFNKYLVPESEEEQEQEGRTD